MSLSKASLLSVQIVESAGTAGIVQASLVLTNNATEPLQDDWRLYFSMGLAPAGDESPVVQTLIDGRYGYLSPGARWKPLLPGQTIEIPIKSWLFDGMPLRARQGFNLSVLHRDKNTEQILGPPTLLPPVLQSLDQPPGDWIAQISPSTDLAPLTPEHQFEKNLASQDSSETSLIPAPRSVTYGQGTVTFTHLRTTGSEPAPLLLELEDQAGFPLNISVSDDLGLEAYTLAVTAEEVAIQAGSVRAAGYAAATLRQLIRQQGAVLLLPECTVSDEPDFEHRAVYIDLSRHFQPVSALKPVIQAMAGYKLNRLQLGIANDEGWRLEIAGRPELTDIGARRCFDATTDSGEVQGLYPAWGDGPETDHHYLSADEFVDLLQFAKQHQVEIILEINLPAHANALIRSMKASGRYQLVDPEDHSEYVSAQGYRHNVVNICAEDTYLLARDILEAAAQYYARAGVALDHLHLGGDEVPEGAWLQSPLVRRSDVWQPDWDPDKDAPEISETLIAYFADRITHLAAEILPGTRLGFWHEMSPGLPRPFSGYVNGWTTEAGDRQLIDALLQRDQHLVISNASYLYLDMPYALHRDEPGLPWAGYIDEAHIYGFDPIGCWQIDNSRRSQVYGLQAQLWSETIFTPERMHYHLFPRLLAVAERAWNAAPDMGRWPGFARAVGEREIAWLDSLGIHFRVPPPGARLVAGELHANVVYPSLNIHYTMDGTVPDGSSPTYSQPIPVGLSDEVRLVTVTDAGRCSRIVTCIIKQME